MNYILIRKILAIIIISIFLSANFAVSKNLPSVKEELQKEIYIVPTKDHSSITLTRYNNSRRPSIILIHGMGCNHKIFDYDENHSHMDLLLGENASTLIFPDISNWMYSIVCP